MSARFQFDRQTPVTMATLVAYVGLAFATGSGGAMSPSWESLDRFGGAIGTRIAQGEVWRLLSYAYLHGGLIHLACNAMALWSLGPQLAQLSRPEQRAELLQPIATNVTSPMRIAEREQSRQRHERDESRGHPRQEIAAQNPPGCAIPERIKRKPKPETG